ncbi:MAG: biotin transporter BioY [Firmicutes bacterium]|nr:biotin transporter BioY [Bacillota bacterium]
MKQNTLTTRDIAYIAIFAALIAICSWISIPTTVPFTLQTFAVFLTCMILGGKKGTIAVLIYILLGSIGLPVFANFAAGFGVILGTTGGYIVGFIASGLIMWAFEKLFPNQMWATCVSMILGLAACYAIGTAWFMVVYAKSAGAVGLMTVLGWCVIPFIIPDLIKIVVALVLGQRLKKIVKF